ncbi:glycosyltransferase family 2 protein [Eilatimonas milleporae]|uniref:GT2 family glycosyltransferase n=1 Tax=Eilatimonas milleporae TaxID=911205 RepID=A0A3M0CSB7_9PROT|nr:glycosyltransferase family 2 protein [Eilatimonas milleporae]RMB12422.1 GT2 family glycosyltransferase [Eilatimonas milleporae]
MRRILDRSKRVTLDDIRGLYLLILGRAATDEEERQRLGADRSFFSVMRTLIGGQEFRHQVLKMAIAGRQLVHDGLSARQYDEAAAILPRHLRVTAPPKTDQAPSRKRNRKTDRYMGPSTHRNTAGASWAGLLLAAMDSPRLQDAFEQAVGRDTLADFRTALTLLERWDRSSIIGHIEDLVSMVCRGYALDTDNPDRSLRLDFFVNNHFIGGTLADLTRRDLQERHGGHGRFGFEFPLNVPPSVLHAPQLRLQIVEHDSRTPVCRPRNVMTDRANPVGYIQRMARDLARLADKTADGGALDTRDTSDLADTLARIEKALPALEHYGAVPRHDYDLYASLYPPRRPQAPLPDSSGISVLLIGDTPGARSAGRDSVDAQTLPPLHVGAVDSVAAITDSLVAGLPGDHVLLLPADDRLSPHALEWFAVAAVRYRDAGIITCDHDYHAGRSDRYDRPHFKPCFDYDMLLERNIIGHSFIIRRDRLAAACRHIPAANTAWDLALLLAAVEAGGEDGVVHLDRMLWHRTAAGDDDTPETRIADETAVVTAHLARVAPEVRVTAHTDPFDGDLADARRIVRPAGDTEQRLAIIIPTRNALDMIRPCVESLLATLSLPEATDIIIMDNGSDDPETLAWLRTVGTDTGVTVCRDEAPFNWSALNNRAAGLSDAELLLFLNNDTLALRPGWDRVLRGQLARPNVGAVGARLLYEDGTIQHGGVVLYDVGVAAHEAAGESCTSGLYLERSKLTHGNSAVTGAFLGCRREVFEAAGGFEAETLRVAFNDVDFCLKVREHGLKVLYVPEITFNHLESKSRGYDHQDDSKAERALRERLWMEKTWGDRLHRDPFYPRVFSRRGKAFAMLKAPGPPHGPHTDRQARPGSEQ